MHSAGVESDSYLVTIVDFCSRDRDIDLDVTFGGFLCAIHR